MKTLYNTIKIKYSRLGYLPDYPPHLISDEEMFDVFLPFKTVQNAHNEINEKELCVFKDFYPNILGEMDEKYNELIDNIAYHINIVKTKNRDDLKLPDWIYTYMLGEALSPTTSTYNDLQSVYDLLNIKMESDSYNEYIYKACYNVSEYWLSRYPVGALNHRPPTMFIEPHVLKALRLAKADPQLNAQLINAIAKEI